MSENTQHVPLAVVKEKLRSQLAERQERQSSEQTGMSTSPSAQSTAEPPKTLETPAIGTEVQVSISKTQSSKPPQDQTIAKTETPYACLHLKLYRTQIPEVTLENGHLISVGRIEAALHRVHIAIGMAKGAHARKQKELKNA